MKTVFETETCSRCQGSGRYSFCQRYADRCFRCHGAGKTLTKRGQAARAYLDTLCQVPAKDLKAGDRVATSGVTNGGDVFNYIATVVSVEPYGQASMTTVEGGQSITLTVDRVRILTTSKKYGEQGVICGEAQTFTVYGSEHEQKIQQALAYQATLTKTGTVRKNPKKEAV